MELAEGLDPGVLAELSRRDPALHAFAVWDSVAEPARVRFVQCRQNGEHVAYLMVWHGDPAVPYVHWVGSASPPEPLAERLPPRPLIVVAPPDAEAAVLSARGPGRASRIWLMQRSRERPLPLRPGLPAARPLVPEDRAELDALADRNPESFATGYRGADLTRARVFGAFEAGRLVSVGRCQAEPPGIWMVGGVFTEPAARGHGAATAVTRRIVQAAAEHAADAALYVLADNTPALAIYEGLRFERVADRRWIALGVDRRA